MRNIWWLPGAFMIFFGVLIFIYPELLAFIVASVFIGIGLTMLTIGRSFRRGAASNIMSYRMYTQQRPPDHITYE